MKFQVMFVISIFLVSAVFLQGAAKRAMTFDDMLACKRLSDPQFSPDGKWLAFSIKTMDEVSNSGHTDIWIVAPDGSNLRQLTTHSSSSWSPMWAPDGKSLAFLSSRSGKTQIWLMSMAGGEPQQITTHYSGAGSFVWSSDGKKIAFTSRVYPDCNGQDCVEKRDSEKEKSAVKARVYDKLLFRHWNIWWDHKRSHIFVMTIDTRKIVDVTPGDYDAPPIALSSGFTFSPDGKELIFTSNHDKVVATSTNNDIWSVPVTSGKISLVTMKCKERNFRGNDGSPEFSPDGKYLSFLSMKREGFEADKKDLILKDMKTGKFTNLTAGEDINIASYQWLPDGQNILMQIDEKGRYKIKCIDIKNGKIKTLIKDGYNKSITISPDGKTFAYIHQTTTTPFEVWLASTKTGKSKQITFFNKDILANIEMNPAEDFTFNSKDGTEIHGFIIKPPNFDKREKYPMVYMIHGGPQGAWHDGWHYRWNVQMWATQGYVMVLTNPRGSTGYGQKFTDEISKDWGGKVFEDLVSGQKYVIEKYKVIDKDRIAAAGASYGGYMINWIEGHMDEFKYPFKCLVNHDGTFNLYAKLLTTEELWFPEWEFGGSYWENKEQYEKWSPHNFVQNFKTPMLVIHGEKDYRLDFGEGLMTFTALRRVGVPAKLVIFPDEGHWVQKPQNSRFWHKTVFEWLDKYIK